MTSCNMVSTDPVNSAGMSINVGIKEDKKIAHDSTYKYTFFVLTSVCTNTVYNMCVCVYIPWDCDRFIGDH